MNKNKNYLILFSVILGTLFFWIVKANPIPVGGSPAPMHFYTIYNFLFLWFFVCLFLELIFGLLLFFRKNAVKGVLAILIANIISYPLFYLYYIFSIWVSEYYNLNDYLFLFQLIIGEILVIFLETFIIRLILRKELVFKKCLLISFVLNLISLAGGFLTPLIFTTLIN